MILEPRLDPVKTHRIGRFLHGVFGEFFGNVIYDGIWVGRDSDVLNTDGLRQDVIEGCIEAGVTAVRWPGGSCADYYHWQEGVGPERWPRVHPRPYHRKIWRHDFGTDEFIQFCRLIDSPVHRDTLSNLRTRLLDWRRKTKDKEPVLD